MSGCNCREGMNEGDQTPSHALRTIRHGPYPRLAGLQDRAEPVDKPNAGEDGGGNLQELVMCKGKIPK